MEKGGAREHDFIIIIIIDQLESQILIQRQSQSQTSTVESQPCPILSVSSEIRTNLIN